MVRVVREWMGRMIKIRKTGTSSSGDHNMDCPKCGKFQAVTFYPDEGWMCVWRDCSFTFPREFLPPTPEQFEEYLNRKDLNQHIDKFLNS
ncbi:MAG TPA: hypothetical protein PKZ02_01480 [Candidatus Paceibacterota bacterium]|nr:hypothetical protein [Candidatus Paceibacterota bacterium]